MDQIPVSDQNVTVDFSNVTPWPQKNRLKVLVKKIAGAFKRFKEKIQNFGKVVKGFVKLVFKKLDNPTTDLSKTIKPETRKL